VELDQFVTRRRRWIVPHLLGRNSNVRTYIIGYNFFGFRSLSNFTVNQPQHSITQSLDGAHVVTDEDHRASSPRYFSHLAEALLLKWPVTHRQHLVDN